MIAGHGRTLGFRLPFMLALFLAASCATIAPEKPYSETGTVPTDPEETRTILMGLQKTHPGIHIEAELAPVKKGTETRLTVRTRKTVHMINSGFLEYNGVERRYPKCYHWFYITRSFDTACGDSPIKGSVTALFGDGVGLGALFDIVQLARYPFTYVNVDRPDPAKTHLIMEKMKREAARRRVKAQGVSGKKSPPSLHYPESQVVGLRE